LIRVVIADDQELVREGFRLILEANDDMTVVAEAEDGSGAVDATRMHRPDVVLMDIRMPGLDGVGATREIRRHGLEAHVVMLTTFGDDRSLYEALAAGADGFLLKSAPRGQLAEAVRTVTAGTNLLSPELTRRLIASFVQRPPMPEGTPEQLSELTERELEALRLVCRGLSNAEIAKELFLTEATVKSHVGHILQKLGVRDRVQAVIACYSCGFVQP
jgi:DNA-binding NarL/FixJ family response regulator